ncbi:YhgE/Pip domain-containing protein [Denitrobacterium detoxificans]|uniref:YhgE/Pip domain-containing protein n=1 Tax=Denitrobacterium detoxificans TaxID=79604 RepID=UPI0026F2BA2D|nr:YhgE/Pip domain-containing protein [Denitrobacterium detoxificans]MBE6465421.1 YhgE/Pip domain-containing protein [Denitrobacterium detoxificans]
MRNILRVFGRDFMRLLKSPAALVVIVALIVLPSMYTWFNVLGFWDPYSNTGNLKVCVVNEDTGAYSEDMGQLDLGSQIVSNLEENTQLGWEFTDRDTAIQKVQSGEAYAAFVIPSDFSSCFTTLLSGDIQRPQLEYYVNEKLGAVSPKITDTGATSLDQTINAAFVSSASEVVTAKLDEAVDNAQADIGQARENVIARFTTAQESIASARQSASELSSSAEEALTKSADARQKLQDAKGDIALISGSLNDVQSLTLTAQDNLATMSSTVFTNMDQGSVLASRAASNANIAVSETCSSVIAAEGSVESAIAYGESSVSQNETTIAQLKVIANALPDGQEKTSLLAAIDAMETRNQSLSSSLQNLKTISADTKKAAADTSDASNTANEAAQSAIANADEYRTVLATSVIPNVDSALSGIASTSGSLSSTVARQSLLIDQTLAVLDQLDETLRSSKDALDQTDDLLATLQTSIDTVKADVEALGTSQLFGQIFGVDGNIDSSKVADFMLSPTELTTETLYSVNSFGSAMAPLFTNLTLWIGVFMLMVILKQEVDRGDIKGLTLRQAYVGRGLFLSVLVMLQAIVCCVGNMFLGVQTVNVPLYLLTAVVASLSYLAIQYSLSVLLQHIGKGICIILVFAQIPGATGLYPVEMTPSFFQAIYPLLPFTYGINAMRETIAGFYGDHWAFCMGMLVVFFVVFTGLALIVRPYLTNLNRLFSRQIRESDIMNGEESELPARRFRLAQVISVLADREDYREQLLVSVERFAFWYPRLMRGAWILGFGVPLVVTPLLAFSGTAKLVMLTAWLVWLILIMIFLVVVEHIRDNIEHRVSAIGLTDEQLREVYSQHQSVHGTPLARAIDVLRGGGAR